MIKTRGYKSKDEAAESWNTWAGRSRVISQDDFNSLNDAIERDYPIMGGKLVLPDGDHAFGDLVISEEGGYEHPWPKIYLADYGSAEAGLYGDDDMFLVYKLRARWRLIEKNHLELRRKLKNLLSSNDKDNITLNTQLSAWNVLLDGSGFPLFKDNDLRGADLSGLTISGNNGGRVWLHGVDLSYSECHLLRIVNANLYSAKLIGVKATQLNLTNCTAHGVLFQASYIPDSQFRGADFGYCDFRNSLLSHSIFDGANCHGANFSSALLLKASFGHFAHPETGKSIYANLSEVVWDDNTRFEEVEFNEFIDEQHSKLAHYIQDLRTQKTVKDELVSAVELKPGAFGFSVDLPDIFKAIKRHWKNRKK